MKNKLISKTLTSLSLFGLISCTNLGFSQALKIQTHTASESGFLVNSHLITGKSDAILIDAQFTQSEAQKVVDMIKVSGKSLTTIYITHGHPDHYFGLDLIKKSYPNVKILAKQGVVDTIKETSKGKFEYWKPLYENDLTDKVIVPEVFMDDELILEGQKIEIISFGQGESEHDTSLYIPSTKTLISGDVLYNNVHLWLVEHHSTEWLENLNELSSLDIVKTYPGHGQPSDKELIKKNMLYIENFNKQEGRSYEEALSSMNEIYSDYKLPIILELSLK